MMKTKGFTLLELLITLTVVGIIATIGVPSLRAVIMDNRLASQANQFVYSINMARSAAVRFQRNAIVCASANYDAAVPSCSDDPDWSNGWIVWVDKDRNATPDATEIISVNEPLSDSSTFTSLAVSRFTYDARGFAVPSGAAGTTDGELTLCDDRSGETGRVIKVNNVGRINISRQACS